MAASLAVFVQCFVDRVRLREGRASFGRFVGLAQLGGRRGQRPVRRTGIWTLARTHCRSDTHGRSRKARLAALGPCSVLILASPCAEVSTGPRAFGFFEVRGPGRRRRGAEVSPFAGANYFLY